MVRAFGQRWGHQYASREEAGTRRFMLVEFPLDEHQDIVEIAEERIADMLERLPFRASREAVLRTIAERFEIKLEERAP